MKLRLLLVCMALLASTAIAALKAEYVIKAIGLRVARLYIEHDAEKALVKVSAVSLMSNRMFPRLNNRYYSYYQANYLPKSYLRLIDQDNSKDSVMVSYTHGAKSALMQRSSDGSQTRYAIGNNTRDYFTFMTMLTNIGLSDGKYQIDGNGIQYYATLQYEKTEKVKTDIGTFTARKYSIRFSPITDQKMPYIDMVTHNLLNKDTKVVIWINEDRVAIKATVKKSAIGMSWDLVGYQK